MTAAPAPPAAPPDAIVRDAVVRELGTAPSKISRTGGGLSSQTFNVEASGGRYVVRIGNQPGKRAGFERERRATERARAAGIPTQHIVAVGDESGWAYSIALAVAGEPGHTHPHRDGVLDGLARLAVRVHGIGTVGHGEDYRWAGESGAGLRTWPDFLHDDIDADARLQRLRERDVLSQHQHETLAATLARISAWRDAPVLQHGDLRLKNVLADRDGNVCALLDWETSLSAIGTAWDLSIALHDLSIDDKQRFLTSYGMPDAAIRDAAPVWRLFNVLNYAPKLDELIAADDRAGIERLRTRVSGALDLYPM